MFKNFKAELKENSVARMLQIIGYAELIGAIIVVIFSKLMKFGELILISLFGLAHLLLTIYSWALQRSLICSIRMGKRRTQYMIC